MTKADNVSKGQTDMSYKDELQILTKLVMRYKVCPVESWRTTIEESTITMLMSSGRIQYLLKIKHSFAEVYIQYIVKIYSVMQCHTMLDGRAISYTIHTSVMLKIYGIYICTIHILYIHILCASQVAKINWSMFQPIVCRLVGLSVLLQGCCIGCGHFGCQSSTCYSIIMFCYNLYMPDYIDKWDYICAIMDSAPHTAHYDVLFSLWEECQYMSGYECQTIV